MEGPSAATSLNFNIGVLGHIDSGKTSLCKTISTVASTASFDKNPQSQERGITLDLGFSSFCVPVPAHLAPELSARNIRYIQYTLVDCPGHASLIRTIISGAQIMDLMLLIVDVTKGIQTQTAECLVIGEITCSQMIVVLNKVDQLPQDKREASIAKMKTRLDKVLQSTKFAGCPIVPVAAHAETGEGFGLNDLVRVLSDKTFIPKRDPGGPFLFSVDHCFGIRGQGTVMTGTVLSGSAKLNDSVELAVIKETRKIKSMQMFRQPVQQATQGDRVGICVANFDAKLLERGLVSAPGTLSTIYALAVQVKKIQYFKQVIKNRAKFHVTIGHDTVMAKIQLFTAPTAGVSGEFQWKAEYAFLEEISDENSHNVCVFALIELETPVLAFKNQLMIASRLDADIHQNACRLAFYGHILDPITDKDYRTSLLPTLKIFKVKERSGAVERVQDSHSVIVKNMVKKETDTSKFENLKVVLSTGEKGVIEGAFGKSGKLKVRIPDGLSESTVNLLNKANKKKPNEDGAVSSSNIGKSEDAVKVKLQFRRYVYDPKKQMIQAS